MDHLELLKKLQLGNVRTYGQWEQLSSKCQVVFTAADKVDMVPPVITGKAPTPSTSSFSARRRQKTGSDPAKEHHHQLDRNSGRSVERRRRSRSKRITLKFSDCIFCGKNFTSWSKLEVHMRAYAMEQPYSCPSCHRSFNQRSSLQQHILIIHSGAEKKFGCNLCGKRFHRKGNLKTHIMVHKGVKPYRCDICSKSCSTKWNLQVHRRIHGGKKPFRCNLCKKRFNHKSGLDNHLRWHTGERPFKCVMCQKAYLSPPSFFSHLKSKGHLEKIKTVSSSCI